jgi:DNA uptake protein ComE-like DNA-binding protein
MLLSASLVMAQGSNPTTGSTLAKGTRPVAGAVARTKTTAGTATTTAKTTAAATQAKAPAAAAALLDLNSASKADLMKLPGVGEAISAKIIAGRPWANKAQLLSKGIVTKPVYDKLSALVIARHAAARK